MTAVPTVRTWTSSEIVTAANMITYINGPISWLLAPAILYVRQTGAQTLTTAVAAAVTFGAEDVDSTGMHSTVTNTSRATAVYPGYYWGGNGVGYAANATGVRACEWWINGAIINGGGVILAAFATVTARIPGRGIIFYLNVGDYVETYAFQNSGGNLNTAVTGTEQSSMSLHWVSN